MTPRRYLLVSLVATAALLHACGNDSTNVAARSEIARQLPAGMYEISTVGSGVHSTVWVDEEGEFYSEISGDDESVVHYLLQDNHLFTWETSNVIDLVGAELPEAALSRIPAARLDAIRQQIGYGTVPVDLGEVGPTQPSEFLRPLGDGAGSTSTDSGWEVQSGDYRYLFSESGLPLRTEILRGAEVIEVAEITFSAETPGLDKVVPGCEARASAAVTAFNRFPRAGCAGSPAQIPDRSGARN